jgi:hypothetical protein
MDTNDWKLFRIHRERRPKQLRLELGGLQCALGFLRTEIRSQEFRRANITNIDFELTNKTSRTIDRRELLSLRHSFLDFSYQHGLPPDFFPWSLILVWEMPAAPHDVENRIDQPMRRPPILGAAIRFVSSAPAW